MNNHHSTAPALHLENDDPPHEGHVSNLFDIAVAIDLDKAQHDSNIVKAANYLQEHVGVVDDTKLQALAAIARSINQNTHSHYLGLVLFVWIRDHLCSNTEYGSRAKEKFQRLERIYAEHNRLFYEHGSGEVTNCIIAGRGTMEALVLESAIATSSCMGSWSRYSAWSATFREGYIKSVLQDMFSPKDEHRLLALLLIREDIHLGDYQGISFEEAVKIAKSVSILLSGSITGLSIPTGQDEVDKHSWLVLGTLFNAACEFVAESPLVELLREKIERRFQRTNFPRKFLEMAICCFNEGDGWKTARFLPQDARWNACLAVDNPDHKRLCVITGREIETLALSQADTELSVSEKVALASLSNTKWDGSSDRSKLAQTAAKVPSEAIVPVFELAQDLGGRKFGSDFQMEAFRALAQMNEDERTNFCRQIQPSISSLLQSNSDDDFLKQIVLSIVRCPERERQNAVQRAQRTVRTRSALRAELCEDPEYTKTEVEALIFAAGSSTTQLTELREVIVATRGRLESPVILLRELWRLKVKWNEVESLFYRLADVYFDPHILSHHMMQLVRASRNGREVLCCVLVDSALTSVTIESMLDTPSLAHLTAGHRAYVRGSLRRIFRSEQQTTAEIIRPMLERLRWSDARDGLDEVLRAPVSERVSRRNQFMRSRELPDIENVMRSRSIEQTERAIREIMKLAQPEGSVAIECPEVLDSIEIYILSYFPGLACHKARQLLRDATCISAKANPSRRDIRKRDAVTSRLAEEIRTKGHPSEPETLLSIRAEAPEIANAWRTLAGDHYAQDMSEPLKFTKAMHLGLAHMGTIAAMVWTLIETFPERALHQNSLSPSLIPKEQAEMRFTFIMALAQSIDESNLQLVCSYGLSQRLCIALQGATRYPSIMVDFTSPPQRFTQILQDFHAEHDDGIDESMVAQLQRVLCDGATETERSWYQAELVKYCALADWPSPPHM